MTFTTTGNLKVELLNVFCQPKPISDEIVTDVL